MGHLKRRASKKYQIVIELEPDPVSGKRNFFYKTVNATKPEARNIMNKIESQIQEGTFIFTDITFGEHLQEWFESHKKKLKPMTIESYRQNIENHILPALGKYKLKKLNRNPKILEDYYDEKLKNGRIKGEGGLSNRTVRYHHSIIHRALESALKWKRLKTNPANLVDPPKKIIKEASYLNEKQLIKLLKIVDNKQYQNIFEFAARTGMRRGEILGLQWNLIDIKGKEINVKQNLQRLDNKGFIIQHATKNDTTRKLPLSEKLVPILKEIKKGQAKNKLRLGPNYKDKKLVFAKNNGEPIDPDTVTKIFKKYAKRAGFNDVTFHSLRHSFASIMLKNGSSMKLIQKLLGHTKSSTTADIYSHIPESMKKDAIKKMDQIF